MVFIQSVSCILLDRIIQVNSIKDIVIRCSAISELIFFVWNRFVSKSFR